MLEFQTYFDGLDEWIAAAPPKRGPPAAPQAQSLQASAASSTPPGSHPRGVVTVGNLSGGKKGSGLAPTGFVDVRVDRQSALGNPFPMGQDGHDESYRDTVCEACAELMADPLTADVKGSMKGTRCSNNYQATDV